MSGDAFDLTPTGELLSISSLPTGVIIGVREQITAEVGERVIHGLEQRFPGVRFAIVGGCSSLISFPYDPEQR